MWGKLWTILYFRPEIEQFRFRKIGLLHRNRVRLHCDAQENS